MFFENFILEHAKKLDVRGYIRKLDDGRLELFIEGDSDKVENMLAIAKRGTQHSQIRSIEEKTASFQGFKEFKSIKI